MDIDNSLSGVKQQRRDKILDGAQNQFIRNGFRGTTIEGIAEAVGMSKVTVYGYFKDKDAIFTAVGTRLGARMRVAVMGALETDAPVKDRITNALCQKHKIIFETVRVSPFSAELFMANANLIGDVFRAIDAEIMDAIAVRIMSMGLGNGAAKRKAELIFNAAQGIANAVSSFDQVKRDISELTSALLA